MTYKQYVDSLPSIDLHMHSGDKVHLTTPQKNVDLLCTLMLTSRNRDVQQVEDWYYYRSKVYRRYLFVDLVQVAYIHTTPYGQDGESEMPNVD